MRKRRTNLEIVDDLLMRAQHLIQEADYRLEKEFPDSDIALKVGTISCTIDECFAELKEIAKERTK